MRLPTRPTGRSRAGATDPLRRPRPGLVEIGCAPGAWLAHFSVRGYEITGIDLSPHGVALTRRNMEMQQIEAEIVEADVLDLDLGAVDLEGRFDVVISLGVVEHFDDPAPMFAAHASMARPGATVAIGVPNFKGVNGWLQGRLDREWLGHHNLATLTPERMRELGTGAGLEVERVAYVGGFEPRMFEWKRRSYLGYAATRAGRAFRRMPATGTINGKWISGTLLATYRKPEE